LRTISSSLTYLYKVLFVGFWIGGFTIVTTLMYVAPDMFDGDDVRATRQAFLIATIVGSTFIYWAIARLKTVAILGSSLIVSDHRRKVSVHVSNIERVSGSVLVQPELAWLHFKQPTEFGTKVIFMPKTRFFGGFTPHPIVRELNELVKSAERGAA